MSEESHTEYFSNEEEEEVALSKEDLQEIKQATNIIKNFATAEKIFRQFPPSNVNVREAVGHFNSSLSLFFKKFEKPLKLKVTQTKFLYKDQTIYHNVEKDKSLSFRIYVDGVRGISFAPGAEEREARELMNVYLELSLIDPLENDFVSLFWEKEFSLIDIVTTDVFKTLDETTSEIKEELDFQSTVEGAETLGRDFSQEIQRLARKKDAKNRERGEEEKELIKAGVDVFKFSEDEKLDIQAYLEKEEKYEPVFDFINLVFTLFSIEQDSDIFPDIVKVIGTTIQGFIKRYQFEQAASLLGRIREHTLEGDRGFHEGQKETVRAMIRALGTGDVIETVTQHLINIEEEEAGAVFQFLAKLDPSVLPDLFDLVTRGEFSDYVADLFVELGRDQFVFFENRLDEYDTNITVLLLDVLYRIDLYQALPVFIERMKSSDPKVRSRCVQTLMKHDMPQLKVIFKEALHDPNESNQIVALRYYNKHSYPDIFPELAALFRKKEFASEKQEKQQLVIGAMVKANMSESFQMLKEVLTKKSLFSGKKYIKFQKDIIRTLSGLSSIEVAELLLKLYGSGDLPSELGDQCKMAISSIHARTSNDE